MALQSSWPPAAADRCLKPLSATMPPMRVTAVVALMLVLTAGCVHVRPASAFQKATSMEQYERAMWDAVKEGKWLEVQSHMAETYLATMPAGVMDRAAMLEHYKRMKIAGYEISDFQSRPNGSDMVVTYRIRLRGAAGDQSLGPAIQVLTVWQTVKRGWIQIAQSAGPATIQP